MSLSNGSAPDDELEGGDKQRVGEKVVENRSTSKTRLDARFRQEGRDLPELGVAMASTLPGTTLEHRSVPMQVDS